MVYIQYWIALHKIKRAIAKGYEGYGFPYRLDPKVEKMIENKGYIVGHILNSGTIVRIYKLTMRFY